MNKPTSINAIALICLILAVAIMTYLFWASRGDPSLRIAALVAGTGLVASLSAIASTILTGKDVTKPEPTDLPPGSAMTTATSQTINTPPV